MLTRKSGILALALGVAFLGACEQKEGDIILPPTPTVVTLQIAPDPVPNLNIGQTFQLVSIVTGSTTQTATWSSSNTAVATVNATTGLVTAVAAGDAVISAVSTADTNARDAVAVRVNPAPAPPPAPANPTISIGTINMGGTLVPVNPGAVAGVIDVVANVRVPAGSSANRLQVDLVAAGDTSSVIAANVCFQTMTAPTTGADDNVTIVCSVNTAALDAEGRALIANNSYRVAVRVCNTGLAACTLAGRLNSAFSQPLVFNNMDVLNAVLRFQGDAPANFGVNFPAAPAGVLTRAQDLNGLTWFGNGDVVVDIRPAIYSSTQAAPLGGIQSLQLALTSSGPGTSWFCAGESEGDTETPPTPEMAELVDPTPVCPAVSAVATATPLAGSTNLLRAVFPKTTSFGAGVNGSNNIEDRAAAITLGSVTTVSGNFFGGIFALQFPAQAGVVPVPVGGINPLRLDNLPPRVTAFDITPGTLSANCPAIGCYFNDGFTFGANAPTAAGAGVVTGNGVFTAGTGAFRMVDFGVDRQTVAFDIQTPAGAAVASGAQGASLTPSAAAETPTASGYVVRATTTDALGNSNARFAPTTASIGNTASVVGSPTAGALTTQQFGVDRRNPVVTAVTLAPPLVNGTDANELPTTITVAFRDTSVAPAGPSGFAGSPLSASDAIVATLFNRANAAGTSAAGTVTVNPCVSSGASSTCSVSIADPAGPNSVAEGYYRVRVRVRDVSLPSGNPSDTTVVVYLDDETAPIVAGVTAPSTILPNTPVTFGADMRDNVELGDNLVSLGYPNTTTGAPLYYAHQPRRNLATFGIALNGSGDLVTDATAAGEGAFTYNPMIYSMQAVGGACQAGTPAAFLASCPNTADAVIVNAVNFAVRDMAGRQVNTVCAAPGADNVVTQGSASAAVPNGSCTVRENNTITPNVIAGGGTATSFTDATPQLFDFVQNDICRATTAIFSRSTASTAAGNTGANSGFDCESAATGTVVTLQAEAHGQQGTLANPFPDGVRFYRQDVSGRWVVITNADGTLPTATVQVFDDDALQVRRWIYTVTTNNTLVPAGTIVRAVGIRGNAALVANNTDTVAP